MFFFRECISNCLLTFLELENLSKSCQHNDHIQFDRSFLLLSPNFHTPLGSNGSKNPSVPKAELNLGTTSASINFFYFSEMNDLCEVTLYPKGYNDPGSWTQLSVNSCDLR